jgi:ABC-type transport system substrate-binding protein
MLAIMKISVRFAPLALAAVLLTGCTVTAAESAPAPAETQQKVEVAITAADISTIDDGIIWARGLDNSVGADELSAGINAIGDLVPDLDIWFADNNEIGGALISLNADVLSDPDNAGTKVDDLNAIVDDLEASIEKGPTP